LANARVRSHLLFLQYFNDSFYYKGYQMIILKLTEVRRSTDSLGNKKCVEAPIHIVISNAFTFNVSDRGSDTHIRFNGHFTFVKETPEQIMEMMMPTVLVTKDDIYTIDEQERMLAIRGVR
jgi:hypothetical protein